MMRAACPFCQMIARQTNTELLYQDELVTAFPDIHPITPVHILIVPNQHITSVNELAPEDEPLLGHLFTVAKWLATQQGVEQSGYRLAVNTGPDAGQSIFHLHMHLIAGRRMPFRFDP